MTNEEKVKKENRLEEVKKILTNVPKELSQDEIRDLQYESLLLQEELELI